MSLSVKLKIMSAVTREGGPRELVTRLATLIYSTRQCYVLRRDLSIPLGLRPEAKIPITVRPLEPCDMPQIVAERPEGLILGVLRAGLPQCYVAVTKDREVCYLQWLVTPEHRDRFRSIRFREMHAFDDDTVMLEFAYTFRRFRGRGIMAPALAWVAEQHKTARWAITYVDRTNIPCLRGCRSAGFYPYRLSCDKWRFFHLIQSVDIPKSIESFWTDRAQTRCNVAID
jgi:hypothetical protein